ncbi:MAG TPA: hypothetical protein PLL10_02020 [Elusimicrobiales bacterium]|nr:hypothetical protein [Elusimicrobiales bacterium]
MIRICSYDFCDIKGDEYDREIPEGEAYACSKCGAKKAFHKACVEKHIKEKHNGKAEAKKLPDVDFPGPVGFGSR